jgi:hypothetical protein
MSLHSLPTLLLKDVAVTAANVQQSWDLELDLFCASGCLTVTQDSLTVDQAVKNPLPHSGIQDDRGIVVQCS